MLWSGTRQICFYLNWMGIRKIYEEDTCRGWSEAFPCPLGAHYVQQAIQTGHLHCLDFAVFLATDAFPTHWQLTALFLPDRGISFSQSCSYSYSQSLSDTLLVKNDPSAVLWGRKWPLHCEKMMDGIYGMSAQGQIFVRVSAHPRACLCAHAINVTCQRRAKKDLCSLICLITESCLVRCVGCCCSIWFANLLIYMMHSLQFKFCFAYFYNPLQPPNPASSLYPGSVRLSSEALTFLRMFLATTPQKWEGRRMKAGRRS